MKKIMSKIHEISIQKPNLTIMIFNVNELNLHINEFHLMVFFLKKKLRDRVYTRVYHYKMKQDQRYIHIYSFF